MVQGPEFLHRTLKNLANEGLTVRKSKVRLVVTIMAATLLASAGVATGIATRLWQSGAEPESPGGALIKQSSESTASGITLEALSATFSGTETVLNFRATDGAGNLIDLVIPDAAFTGDGFRPVPPQGFQRFDDGSFIVELPPVLHPGTVVAEFSEVRVHQGRDRVAGRWALPLVGPSESEFGDVMRLEELQMGTVGVGGEKVTLTGRRSTSRTLIEYDPPSKLRELARPIIAVDGRTVLSIGSRTGPSTVQVAFPRTALGKPVTVFLGPFAALGEQPDAMVLAVADALDDVTAGTDVALTSKELISGPSGLVLAVNTHEEDLGSTIGRSSDAAPRPSGQVEVVEFTLRGNWHPTDPTVPGDPETTTPALYDAQGRQLFRIRSVINYSKDWQGNIGEGQTRVVFWLHSDVDLARMTVVLGPPSRVLSGPWSVTLGGP